MRYTIPNHPDDLHALRQNNNLLNIPTAELECLWGDFSKDEYGASWMGVQAPLIQEFVAWLIEKNILIS